jgi:CubicO group peptidase (beta-lactamase class C family)
MRSEIARTLVLLAAVSLVTACQPSQQQKISARMDEIVRYHVGQKTFIGSVLVAKGEHVVFSKGYGLANMEWNIPNTPSTKYRIGSVTKQFTAAAILLLEEQGKLRVEDLVKRHWPDAPSALAKITIFHLLTHTSGLPDGLGSDWQSRKLQEASAEKTVRSCSDKPLAFEAGSQFSYSNCGYILLGYLIERISGQAYGDFMRERIFTPLDMKDSGVDSNVAIIAGRAAGYSPGQDGFINADYVNMTNPHGAGALYSTPENLLRWTRGLFGGKLLSAASLKKMTTPFKDDYAFGIGVRDKVITHSGSIDGFAANLTYLPEEKVTIAVLANLGYPSDPQDRIAEQLVSILHGEAVVLPAERREISMPEDDITKFTGQYELDRAANMIVTKSNGKLVAQLRDDSPREMLAESETRFFDRNVDQQIEFERGANGAVTGALIYRDGEKYHAKRLPVRAEVRVPPDTLNRYAGLYELSPGLDVAMTVENGHLMAQVTGQAKQQLYAEGETRFFFKTVNAQVEFNGNTNGQITGLMIHQGGDDVAGRRR